MQAEISPSAGNKGSEKWEVCKYVRQGFEAEDTHVSPNLQKQENDTGKYL